MREEVVTYNRRELSVKNNNTIVVQTKKNTIKYVIKTCKTYTQKSDSNYHNLSSYAEFVPCVLRRVVMLI